MKSIYNKILIALLVMVFLNACYTKSTKGVLGNTVSRSNLCDDFSGIFRAYGRFDPRYGVGDPIPNIPPQRVLGYLNHVFIGKYFSCNTNTTTKSCTHGMNTEHTSMVIRYADDHLYWATVHSPSGEVVYYGRNKTYCEAGKIIEHHTANADIPLNVYTFPITQKGTENTKAYKIINKDGWLAGYKQKTFKGITTVIPRLSTDISGWYEFPPDTDIQLDIKGLFDALYDTEKSSTVKRASPKKYEHQQQLASTWPAARGLTLKVHRTYPLTTNEYNPTDNSLDRLLLTLQSIDEEQLQNGYYKQTAVMTASSDKKGTGEKTITFIRGFLPSNNDLQFTDVFGWQIALDLISENEKTARVMIKKS